MNYLITHGPDASRMAQDIADEQHERLTDSPHNTPETPYRAERAVEVIEHPTDPEQAAVQVPWMREDELPNKDESTQAEKLGKALERQQDKGRSTPAMSVLQARIDWFDEREGKR